MDGQARFHGVHPVNAGLFHMDVNRVEDMARWRIENGFFQSPFPVVQGLCMGENVCLHGFELLKGDRVKGIVIGAERYGFTVGGFH